MNVFVFGPSCGGKSTLSKALAKSLENFIYLDRDVLLESKNFSEDNVDTYIDEKVSSTFQEFIVDAQAPWREKQNNELYILVSAPLKTLLERDAHRTQILDRDSKRAFYAREFVIHTYETCQNLPESFFNLILDSSKMTLNEELHEVKKCISDRMIEIKNRTLSIDKVP